MGAEIKAHTMKMVHTVSGYKATFTTQSHRYIRQDAESFMFSILLKKQNKIGLKNNQTEGVWSKKCNNWRRYCDNFTDSLSHIKECVDI
jgi:hypothetical protein